MARVLVLYHSIYGHIETMAHAVAEGASGVAGASVTLKRVPETMSPEAFAAIGGRSDQPAPIADPAELADYDALIFGTGTRFGNMTGERRPSELELGMADFQGRHVTRIATALFG
ncbi:hypothetical protein KOI35_27070 [Actinoplanes bogorensis]|uniref:Flavodoxin-like domain-containing protein n=1 Tax=Paractinoplanes bogorensis TaxID=1610840 RepID=A0ABS5YUT2_9ACTN|nr:hypothetical protein [Actinoplanes bogorensis]